MVELLLLLLGGCGLSAGVLTLRLGEARRWRADLVAYQLRFPRDLKTASVTDFIRGIGGIVAPRTQRPFTVRAVVLIVTGSSAGLRHHLLVPRSLAGIVLASLRASLPQVVADRDDTFKVDTPSLAAEVGLRGVRQLRTENQSAISAALLSAISTRTAGEAVTMQLVLSPCGPRSAPDRPPPSSSKTPRRLFTNVPTSVRDDDDGRAAKEKHADAMFNAVIRVGVTAASSSRSGELLHRVLAAFHTANSASGAHLHVRRTRGDLVAKRVMEIRLPLLGFSAELNAQEITGLSAFPTDGPEIEGLGLGVSRRLAPSEDLPRTGLVLATSNYPGRIRDIAIGFHSGAMEHTLMVAPTGAGKSTALSAMAHQVMESGYGALFIDPNRDAARAALHSVPSSRIDDIVWFDPSDDLVVGFNPFEGMEHVPELAGDLLVSTTRHRWGEKSWGPQMEELMWVGGTTLAATGQTLAELSRVYSDEAFRTRLLSQIDDPFVAQVWARFNAWSPEERARASQSVLNKVRLFTRPELRSCLGARHSSLDLDAALRDGRIVLASLPKSKLGNDGAMILAGLLMGRFWTAVLRRGELPPAERKPFLVFVDEAHELVNLPVSLGLALAESRKHGVGWVLATQTLAGFPNRGGLLREVLTNTRTKVAWSTSAAEAQALARELGPDVRPEDVQYLGLHEVIVAASLGGKTAAPATGNALGPVPPSGHGDAALERSRTRFARPRTEVEAEIRARQTERAPGGNVGRRRRA